MNIKIGKTGITYVPNQLTNMFGRKVVVIPNAAAAVLFSDTTDLEDVLKSLEIISADIAHRLQMMRKEKKEGL